MIYPPHKAPSSGAQSLIGYIVDLTAEDGAARVVLDMLAPHMNRNGTLHGGIHAMMLDAAGGFAASRFLGEGGPDLVPVVTLSLTTNFVAPGAGDQVIATGRVTGGGRKIIHSVADIRDRSGTVLSQGTGVFKRVTR